MADIDPELAEKLQLTRRPSDERLRELGLLEPDEPGLGSRPRSYEDWRSGDSIDRRASTWLGQATGGLIVCFVYSLPIYLLIAAFAGGITVIPDTREEWMVLGVIVAVAAVPFFTRLVRGEVDL